MHPVGDNAKIMVVVPEESPYTTPLEGPTVATVVLVLVHTPVPEASASVVLLPAHTIAEPEIPTGNGSTVTVANA